MLSAALQESEIALAAVVLIEVADAVIVERMAGRLVCAHGHAFHERSAPPERAGICDLDGAPLDRRPDDEPATVRRRLNVYHDATAPLVHDYYEERGLLRRVDGTRDPDEVFAAIQASISLRAA